MINHQNYVDIKEYIRYKKVDLRRDERGMTNVWFRLKYFLKWADDKPFGSIPKIKPGFPEYIENIVTKQNKPLSADYLKHLCKEAIIFLRWAKTVHPKRYRLVTEPWLQQLIPSRERAVKSELTIRDVVDVEEVIKIAKVPCTKLTEKRIQAAAAFLFLSGMRIEAFLTLPVNCVLLQTHEIEQLPTKGVKTKGRKPNVSVLLPVPILMSVVEEWDSFIRNTGSIYWYPTFQENDLEEIKVIENRDAHGLMKEFRVMLKEISDRAGITYHSPHKYRHGHIIYGLKHARTPAEYKAVSQNVAHANTGTTDEIYGHLIHNDVKKVIDSFTYEPEGKVPVTGIEEIVQAILTSLVQSGKITINE